MKKPVILFTTLLTLICNQSFSQNQQINSIFDIDNFFNDNGLKENTKAYDDIKGSPFINDEFKKANISLEPDLLFYIKYNAFVDQMEVMGKNKTSFALNKSIDNVIVNFLEDKKTYQVFSHLENDVATNRFFNVLNPNAKTLLLKKEEITLKEKQPAKTTYEKDKPARFAKSPDSYYIKYPNKLTATELPSNKKEFAKKFPNIENKILEYIKSEKIKLSKEADLINLFKELNRLKS